MHVNSIILRYTTPIQHGYTNSVYTVAYRSFRVANPNVKSGTLPIFGHFSWSPGKNHFLLYLNVLKLPYLT